MYTGTHARLRPLQPAFIMASSGEAVTYAELEARSNRLAHLFRRLGLRRLDHYAIFMENNSRYLEACGAGERSGLYFTCVNSYLTPSELAQTKGKKSSGGDSVDQPGGNPGTNAVLSPSQLGYTGGFSGLFGGNKSETTTFKEEPTRDSLTQPPPGYQTPSPNFAYGTGPKESLNKEYNPAQGKYGE